jgi:ATP-dependent Clp protease ATP-binding subunit ClpX
MIKQFKEMYKFDTDVDLDFTEGALKEIATRAKAKKIGARGLRSVLEEVLDEVGFEYPSIKDLRRIVINDDLTYDFICESKLDNIVDAKDVIDLEEGEED